jgi:uncharacterized protein with ParB-like and HNH nuclease domain
MRAHQKDLLRYLSNSDTQYVIPVYQRNYSWKIMHCEQLLNDLFTFISTKQSEQYFMGSVVSIHNEHHSSEVRELLVIDGQQRLTTITLILLSLYHLLKNKRIESESPKRADEIHEQYLVNAYSTNKSKRLRLKPIEKDNTDFEKLFENPELLNNSTSTIAVNYKWICKKLEQELNTKETVDDFFKALKKLFIVDIELESSDDPQLIFESLNNSGKKLDQSDLIRNAVLMHQTLQDQERLYKKYWQVIEENTYNPNNKIGEKDETTEFIRYFLIYKLRASVKQDEIYLKFKRFVKENTDIDVFLEELVRFSKYYKYLILDEAPNQEIEYGIKRINRLNLKVCYSLLFEVLEQFYHQQSIDLPSTIAILELVESFLLRRLIVELPSSLLNKLFPQVLSKLVKDESCIPLLEQIQRQFSNFKDKSRFPNNAEFKSGLEIREIYKLKDVGRYFLERLEHFQQKERIELTKDLSIEHIMPRKLTPLWKKELGENYEQVHSEYLNRLGNLTFTGYNSQYSNKSFQEKLTLKGGFNESPIWLNSSVKNCDVWNEVSIRKRSDLLIKRAIEIWKDLPRLSQEETKDDDYFDLSTDFNLVTSTKPTKLELFNSSYMLSSWKDLYCTVLKVLHEKDELKLSEVSEGRLLYSTDKGLRNPTELVQGLFIETHLSAPAIFKNLQTVTEFFTENEDDFKVWYE